MRKQGGITVFLSLSLLCVFALISVMVEQARTAGSRYYFQVAVNASLDTLFSQYHRELWKRYRILGLPYDSKSDVTERIESYVEKYLEVDNWYPIQLEKVELETCKSLTDDSGDYLIQEILDYMKFGIWNSLELMPEDGQQLWKDVKEAVSAGTMTRAYNGQEKEVRRLEKAVDNFQECVSRQEKYAEEIQQALDADDPDTFYSKAADFRREAGRMDSLWAIYEKRANQVKSVFEDSEKEFWTVGNEFQENRKQLFEEQMNPYAAYVEEDGKRYQELRLQVEASKKNLELLRETELLVERLEEEADADAEETWEAGDMAEDEGGDVYGDDDEYELSLSPAADLWSGFLSATLHTQRQKGDEEKRGFLEQVRNLVDRGLLQLVLPDDMEVSDGVISLTNQPSLLCRESSRENHNAVEQVLIHEYCGEFFLHALKEEKGPVQYEMEYLLQGEKTDRENLSQTIEQIFLVRQGLNLIHILSDGTKREEANALAATITGITGMAPLLEITACFIMVVWAMGEAVIDLRTLMAGGKVPLWKSVDQWQLSLEGLLEMGKENGSAGMEAGNDEGLTYVSYLKLLLLAEDREEKQLRMLDVIQMNLQQESTGFLLQECAYQVDIRGIGCGKHVFFALPFVENILGKQEGYPLEAKAGKSY